jgi:hypothetical protein
LFAKLTSNIVKLGNANCRSLANIGVFVAKGAGERLAKVLSDAVDADAAHGPDGEGTDQGVGVIGILDERVDSQEGELGLGLGVVDEVQVHQFLEFDIARLDAVEDVSEEHGDVLADGHAGNDLLDGVDLGVAVGRMKLETELVHLTLLLGGEEAAIGATGILVATDLGN